MSTSKKIGLCVLVSGVLGLNGLVAAGETSQFAHRRLMAIVSQLQDKDAEQIALAQRMQAKKEHVLRCVKRSSTNDGDIEVLRCYLENGLDFKQSKPGDPNLADDKGNTLLHLAVASGSFEAIQWLLVFNANVNANDGNGETPFDTFIKGKCRQGDHRIFFGFIKRQPVVNVALYEKNYLLTKRFCGLLCEVYTRSQHLLDSKTKQWFNKLCITMNDILISQCSTL